MNLFTELRRRNVFRVAAVYIVTGWLILQIADVLLERFGVPDWGFRFVTILLVLGFPVAVIFSWVYEITPDGIRKEKDIEHDGSITGQTARKLNYLLVGLMVGAVGLLLANRFWPAGDEIEQLAPAPAVTPAPERTADGLTSVAVLPFVNMSNDPDNEYFSDGISEELLNVLVKVEGLRVPSRTSSFSFKGQETPIVEIAQVLGVDHVLEGSVRKAGNTVRITAQLIDVRTDTHLWSDTYDRELTDIFAIQDEIANSIVQALMATLGTEMPLLAENRPTDSLEAYELYLRARFFLRLREEENLRRSIELFKQALELDPEFAQAWSGLATAYHVLPGYTMLDPGVAEYTMLDPGVGSLAVDAASTAVALDGSLAEPRAVLARMLGQEGKQLESLRAFEELLEIAPHDSIARLWYGIQLFVSGYLEQARKQVMLARELDPVSALHLGWVGLVEDVVGNQEQASKIYQEAMALGRSPSFYQAFLSHAYQGRYGEARELVSRGVLDGRYGGPANFLVIEALENPDKAPDAIAALEATGHYVSTQLLFLGEPERALENTIEFSAGNDAVYIYFWFPYAKTLRQNPGFRTAMEQHGFVSLWQERGWPDLCHPVGDSFECD